MTSLCIVCDLYFRELHFVGVLNKHQAVFVISDCYDDSGCLIKLSSNARVKSLEAQFYKIVHANVLLQAGFSLNSSKTARCEAV